MNVTGTQDTPLSRETWNEPEMKRALADRDISSVYRLLRRVGISQRHIAALTGQSQSEVSEILKGRQVMAYDVLVRIAGGLGIPRGYMGLAYDPATAASIVETPDDADNAQAEEEAKSVKRRNLLAHGTAVMFGTTAAEANRGQWLPSPTQTPTPQRIGLMDVKQVEATTRAMRSLDQQYGGGTCRDAVIAQLSWAQRLLGASGKEEVRLRLFRALGDLHNLAGWTSCDVGLLDSGRNHYATALGFAKQSGDSNLLSNIMYRTGYSYLHEKLPNEALKWFQLGQIAAQESGSEQAVAVLCANEAVAYAMLRDDIRAQKLLERSQAELARADPNDVPTWAKFFDQSELTALTGVVHHELEVVDLKHGLLAIPALTEVVNAWEGSRDRGRALCLARLATTYLRQGEVEQGLQISHKTLITASMVQSQRVTDRMQVMETELARLSTMSNNADAREMYQLVQTHRRVSV
ncbi:MAG: helix-turn-helix transcriptional regulator [Pseudonocardiales bacterium]|nr:helix-turn-helix transcriptional regulator [Pseudonocardiales bacterium]